MNLAAQQHGDETGPRGTSGGTGAVQARLGDVGYLAYTWNESFVVSRGDLGDVVARCRSDRRSRGMSP